MSTKHTLEQLINISKDVFKTCSINDALIELTNQNTNLVVSGIFSQLDMEKNDRQKFQKSFIFDVSKNDHHLEDKQPILFHATQPQSIRNDVWCVKSPNGSLKASVTNWKDSSNTSNEENQFIEIWNKETRVSNVNLSKLEKHGKVYENSSSLGSFVWSSDSSRIAYVAEKKRMAKEKSFFGAKLLKDMKDKEEKREQDLKVDDDDYDVAKKKDEFTNETNYEEKYANFFKDDWGEQYVGKAESCIAVYDLASSEVKVLDKLPRNIVPAQLTW